MHNDDTSYEQMPGYGEKGSSIDAYQESVANEWEANMEDMPEFTEIPNKSESPVSFEEQNPNNSVKDALID